jgi:hypothetical protein
VERIVELILQKLGKTAQPVTAELPQRACQYEAGGGAIDAGQDRIRQRVLLSGARVFESAELVGQGLGRAFLDVIAPAAGRRFAGRALRATVAAFNRRALKLVTGFVEVERCRGPDDLEFVVFVRRGAE